ncbi:probable U3 small nucleolar RNA-associated protein 11 [Clytia hemisphaerica]|uniref:probable U3 small nucleolar RNA-associated protein 11 n=1 Tax=Clytia hemisphaerica TaxID=252671 RepID=UPI0034D6D2EC
MSSLKSAMKSGQRTHRERGQVSGRKHLGNLEKHKDYVLRAKDFHRKKQIIKGLKKKAFEKNPDEFYFQMVSSKTKKGVHIQDRPDSKQLTKEQIKLMKTQDVNYLNVKHNAEAKKIEKLKSNLHFTSLADAQPRTHIFFVDSKKEAKNFDAAERMNTHPEFLSRTHNIPTLETLKKMEFEQPAPNSKAGEKGYKELQRRIERKSKLNESRNHLVLQRKLMGKGSVRKQKTENEDDEPPVFKWKSIRKR